MLIDIFLMRLYVLILKEVSDGEFSYGLKRIRLLILGRVYESIFEGWCFLMWFVISNVKMMF